MNKRIILLGSTGSIGRQTIEVVAHLNGLAARGEFPHHFEIVGLAAGRDRDALVAQATSLDVKDIAIADGEDLSDLARSRGLNLRQGADAAERLVREVDADIVLGAIVGIAGLGATLAAVELGREVALANKETLVAAGSIVVAEAKRTGACLLPVDSEHSAIWQCLLGHVGERTTGARYCPPGPLDAQVRKVILTASGGALRTKSREEVYHATPADALAHPTWSMGAKVTIDTASLMNKALELIEAHWLYDLPASKLEALVHPQSIIHSFVEFEDGSVIAQLGAPDMRTPIQFALTFPHHVPGRAPMISWESMSRLDFQPPDLERFPALALGHRVIELGGTSGAIFNAANEAAVEAFLQKRIPFGRITELTAAAIDEVGVSDVRSLADVLEADRAARRYVGTSMGAEARV